MEWLEGGEMALDGKCDGWPDAVAAMVVLSPEKREFACERGYWMCWWLGTQGRGKLGEQLRPQGW